MDASKPLVKVIRVNTSSLGKGDPEGISLIRVSYQWVSLMCTQCKVFGHSADICSKFLPVGNQLKVRTSQGIGSADQGKVWREVSCKGKSIAFEEDSQSKEVETLQDLAGPST